MDGRTYRDSDPDRVGPLFCLVLASKATGNALKAFTHMPD